MRSTILLFLLIGLTARSQQKLVFDEKNKERYLVLELASPNKVFVYDEKLDMEYLLRKENNNYFILDSVGSDAGFWGWLSYSECYASNDTIYLKSYKHMSALNGFFISTIDKNKLIGVDREFENPNDGMVEKADSLLEAGNIRECVQTLHGVQYPYNEYDTWGYGIQIMEKAHSLAVEQYQIKNFDSSIALLADAFEYWENSSMLGFTDEKDFEETQDDGFNVWEEEQLKLWIGDYGLFLYLAKDYQKSIEINSYLNMIYPDCAGPYLQLGDTYFDTGKVAEAKNAYKKYADLKMDSGQGREIPKRVKDRLK